MVPPGAGIVGCDYHTHGDYSALTSGRASRVFSPSSNQLGSDGFSIPDYRGIVRDANFNPAYRGYLGTPSGVFRAYDPVRNHEYVIK